MPDPIRISVIICTWNRAARLAEALSSIERSIVPASLSWEVVIVDNNSTDDTKAVSEQFIARNPLRYRYLFEKRQGKSFALNLGVESARGDILVFTDDDVTVDPLWLAEIAKIYDNYSCVGVGGRIVDTWKSAKPDWLTSEGPYKLMAVIVRFDLGEEPCELKVPPYGANLSFRKDALRRFGSFRTDLGPTGGKEFRGEDTELCWRMLRAGETLIYAPKAIVFHPVPENRITKRYFAEWYYAFGESMARITPAPAAANRYFGFPQYMLREFLQDLFLWLSSASSKRRFFYKLEWLGMCGRLREERRRWRGGGTEIPTRAP
jgi:glycosyltransferase involved in cell wall biosynthesis